MFAISMRSPRCTRREYFLTNQACMGRSMLANAPSAWSPLTIKSPGCKRRASESGLPNKFIMPAMQEIAGSLGANQGFPSFGVLDQIAPACFPPICCSCILEASRVTAKPFYTELSGRQRPSRCGAVLQRLPKYLRRACRMR